MKGNLQKVSNACKEKEKSYSPAGNKQKFRGFPSYKEWGTKNKEIGGNVEFVPDQHLQQICSLYHKNVTLYDSLSNSSGLSISFAQTKRKVVEGLG